MPSPCWRISPGFDACKQHVAGRNDFYPTSDGFIGTKVAISGGDLTPGKKIPLMRGTTLLNADGPLSVVRDGTFNLDVTVGQDAKTGLQPIVVIGENPAAATVVDLKVSPRIPVSGQVKFAIFSQPVTGGLYEVAYSPESDALFLAPAVDGPPVKQWALVKVHPETLETISLNLTRTRAPGLPRGPGSLPTVKSRSMMPTAPSGLTNTRQDTVALYRRDDLSLGRQFELDAAPHPRDVVIGQDWVRASVRTSFSPEILVFDTYHAQGGLVFIAAQQTDKVLIPKAETGKVRHDIEIGGSPLDVTVEPVSRLALVANRGSGTIAMVDQLGQIVANLDAGSIPKQLHADGKGNVYAVNQSRGESDEDGDRVWRIHVAD